MQVDNRWAEPVVSQFAPVPSDGTYQAHHIEETLPATPLQPLLSPKVLFPPKRVEPVDMPRLQQIQNRNKTGYISSVTTDEQHPLPPTPCVPIKRVTHPVDRSYVAVFLKRLWRIVFFLFISIPCVIFITLILPFSWIIKIFFRFTCRYHCTVTPCTCSYLSASDLFWLYNSNASIDRNKTEETTKLNAQITTPITGAVFFLDGTVNENSLKKILLNRLIINNSRRGSNAGHKLFPRFSQLLVPHFSGTMWIDYSPFSIDEHVREIPRNIQTDEELQAYVSTLMSTNLPFDRPLWQLYYKNRSSLRPNDGIIVFVYHPVLSDGISMIRILLKHIVDNRTTQLDLKPRFASRHGERVLDYVKAYFFGHMLFFSKLFFNSSRDNFFFRRTKLETSNGNLSISNRHVYNQPQRTVLWSTPYSLTQANRMKLVTRSRMNDLLSTVVISCVRLYMEKHGLSNSTDINCVMPCDLRSNSANIFMGNRIAHLSLRLPMDVEGNIPLLWSFNDNTKRVKRNGDYATMYLFTNIVYLLFPVCIAHRMMARIFDNSNLWLTTIAAGSTTTLATMSLCNRDVRSIVCLSPSIGTHSINFCVTTYSDEIRLVVIVDPNLVPDPQFFTECFYQQLGVVQELLAHRRIPGEIRRVTRPPRFPPPKKSVSSISDMSDDLSIQEIQTKMTILQQELLSLKSQFENVDMTDPSSPNQRLIITTKLEELRKEFRELLIKLQERQCELSGMIPSDEEDEMDPHVRVRLRSASVASRISLRSNDQRLLSSKVYQFDKEDTSDFSANGNTNPEDMQSSLSSSLKRNQKQAGIRRAQSVSICENTRVDHKRRTSLNRTRPTTPLRTFMTTNATIVHLDPSENWKNGN